MRYEADRDSAMPPEPSATPPDAARSPWARVVLWLGVLGIVTGGALLALRQCSHGIGENVATLARAFRQGTVKEEFLSSAVKLEGANRYQVATLQEHEVFRRTETDSLVWGIIPLPAIVVQADLPVEYGYFVELERNQWEFQQEGGTILVYPPRLAPGTPAPDVSRLTYYTLEGRVWQDDKGVRERLQGTMTKELRARAVEHVPLVREMARERVRKFIEDWLLRTFRDAGDFQVKVIFPEERPVEQSDGPKLVPKTTE